MRGKFLHRIAGIILAVAMFCGVAMLGVTTAQARRRVVIAHLSLEALTEPHSAALQLKAAHPRHPDIQDQALRFLMIIRTQKLLGRRKDLSAVPNRFEQALEGLADRLVVVHD
jgi:hypothetical protein